VVAARALIDRRGREEEEPHFEQRDHDDHPRDEDDLERGEAGGGPVLVRALAAHAAQPRHVAAHGARPPRGARVGGVQAGQQPDERVADDAQSQGDDEDRQHARLR
jgi:hypothetical protein